MTQQIYCAYGLEVRQFLLAMILVCSMSQHAWAGGISISSMEIDGAPLEIDGAPFDLGAPVEVFPGQPVEICFRGQNYTYLSSNFEEAAVQFWFQSQTNEIVGSKLETIGVINPSSNGDDRTSRDSISKCFWWRAPPTAGSFTLYSHKVPVVASPDAFRTEADIEKLKSENRAQLGVVLLGTFLVSDDFKPKPLPFSLILKVDGQTPGAAVDVQGGITDTPLEISWRLRKNDSTSDLQVQYRYNLYPDDEWSAWGTADKALFDYIMRGNHEFRLQVRYKENADEWIEVSQVSKIGFSINETLISRISAKGEKGVGRVDAAQGDLNPAWVNNELYGRSRAFLAAVQYYENAEFAPLEHVDKDVIAMTAALRANGFNEFAGPPLNSDRETILNALQAFIEETKEGDRIVLYFSMHGFESGTDRQNPYLATRDCDPSHVRAKANCLALSDIEELVRYAMSSAEGGKKAKHALVILDACSVGMGIVRKSGGATSGFVEQAIAGVPGAHIMTAGLAGQSAFVDNVAQISFFTRALVSGLGGQADIVPDGIITLSELEVFVRRQVALETKAVQTPMLGEIMGAGQMIFSAPSANEN